MSWICLHCSKEVEDDKSIYCDACGHWDIVQLVFKSDLGNEWRTKADIDVKRHVYRHLYPGEEHMYVPREEGRHPFSLKRKRRGWCLIPNPQATLATVLNGLICDAGERYNLNDGDRILLASKSDSNKQIAPLTVIFES